MVEVNNLVGARISQKFIRQVLNRSLKLVEGRVWQRGATISVALVDEATIKNLNKKYRKVNKITDVLSFGDLRKQNIVELIICWPVIRKQAENLEHSITEELKIILVHGLLHFLGWRDDTKKQRVKMERKTDEITKAIK